MPLGVDDVRRFSRQIALAEVGPEGQEKILASEVALVGEDAAIGAAARYLSAAGVPKLRRVGRPVGAAAWMEALRGCSAVVRSGFDDDPMLGVAKGMGIPVVVMRAGPALVDLIAFRRHPLTPALSPAGA